MTDNYECPADHKHAASQYCYDFHRCRCDRCVTTRMTGRRNRHRQIAYGRYEGLVPALGTQRRIQGLQVLGWSCAQIGELAGLSKRGVANILIRDVVRPGTRDRINTAYLELLRRGNGGSVLVSNGAKAKGWVSPYAWDDIDTDVTPADVTGVQVGVDDVRVWRAVNGPARQHKLSAAERREAVRLLHARRWSDQKIANQLGCDQQTVFRARDILGLPAYAYHELVKETA